jgi:phospholipid/cholesterol/gamma-HCH transport system substrate-binding protein
LVAAAGYPFPVDAGDTIHGDYANVVFKMQIKLTPVSEGGLLPTTLDDLVTLCRSTPLAPICAPGGAAVDQLCNLLGTLPICTESAAAGSGALPQTPQGSNQPAKPTVPNFLNPSPGGGGSGGSFVQRFFGGLLGGGSP